MSVMKWKFEMSHLPISLIQVPKRISPVSKVPSCFQMYNEMYPPV